MCDNAGKIVFDEDQWQAFRESLVALIEGSYHRAATEFELPGRNRHAYAANRELRWSEPKEPDEIANNVDQFLADYPAKIKG